MNIANWDSLNLVLLGVSATVVFALLWLLVLLLRGAKLADVQFEWNPFSAASRASRAERAGRIGQALRLYARANQSGRLLRYLSEALPEWPVRATLVTAASELLDLGAAVTTNRGAGVPETTMRQLEKQTQRAGDVVWDSVDRIMFAVRLTGSSQPQELEQKVKELDQLLGTIRHARNSLAKLALSDPRSVQTVEEEFRKLADEAEGLKEVRDELTT